MAISDWPLAERPRERLLADGANVLSDTELLAVLLRTGLPGKSAVDLGRELLARFGSISGLLSAGAELLEIKGLGQAKTAHSQAATRQACADTIRNGDWHEDWDGYFGQCLHDMREATQRTQRYRARAERARTTRSGPLNPPPGTSSRVAACVALMGDCLPARTSAW